MLPFFQWLWYSLRGRTHSVSIFHTRSQAWLSSPAFSPDGTVQFYSHQLWWLFRFSLKIFLVHSSLACLPSWLASPHSSQHYWPSLIVRQYLYLLKREGWRVRDMLHEIPITFFFLFLLNLNSGPVRSPNWLTLVCCQIAFSLCCHFTDRLVLLHCHLVIPVYKHYHHIKPSGGPHLVLHWVW